jgi:hypothetical protein
MSKNKTRISYKGKSLIFEVTLPIEDIVKELREKTLQYVLNRHREGITFRIKKIIEDIISKDLDKMCGEYFKKIYDKGFEQGVKSGYKIKEKQNAEKRA